MQQTYRDRRSRRPIFRPRARRHLTEPALPGWKGRQEAALPQGDCGRLGSYNKLFPFSSKMSSDQFFGGVVPEVSEEPVAPSLGGLSEVPVDWPPEAFPVLPLVPCAP